MILETFEHDQQTNQYEIMAGSKIAGLKPKKYKIFSGRRLRVVDMTQGRFRNLKFAIFGQSLVFKRVR